MDDSTPRQTAEADDSLASWIQENCPELPNIIRKHIQTMTNLDGQGQDVLVRLIMISIRDKTWKTGIALQIAESIQSLSFDKICNVLATLNLPESCQRMRDIEKLIKKMGNDKTAIDHTIEILQQYKRKQGAAR